MSTTNNDQPAFYQREAQAILVARNVLASVMDHGRHPSVNIRPEEMPTLDLQTALRMTHDALDRGIIGWTDMFADWMTSENKREFELIKTTVLEMQDFVTHPAEPSSLGKSVAYIRQYHSEKETWYLIQEIESRMIANEPWDDLKDRLENLSNPPPTDDIEAMIHARSFDAAIVPALPVPILSMGGHVLATPGNIVNVQAPAKAGKTAAMTGMLAAIFTNDPEADCLGFTADNPHGHAVIHFDTEQSRYDHDALVRRAMGRAGIKTPPGWFHSVSVADLGHDERWAVWEHTIRFNNKKHGGVFAIFLDGVADMVRDPNDAEESFATVASLHKLAITLDAAIVTVLHENPGSETGKTRGHLGSQIERKAETNLRMAKDAAGITTVWADRARHGHIPKDQGTCFEWSDQAGMHVSCGTAREIKAQLQSNEMEEEVARCIGAVTKTMTYSEVVGYIGEALGLKERAAKNRITKWQTHGFITKQLDGKYTRNQ